MYSLLLPITLLVFVYTTNFSGVTMVADVLGKIKSRTFRGLSSSLTTFFLNYLTIVIST